VRSVLVTGSSSGIGRATVERLAADGWRVFAGVRDFSDGAALDQLSENVTALAIDVTDEAQIAAAAVEVAERTGGSLDGVVANAGIGVGGALEEIEPADLRRVLDVNVVGAVAVTQAVLPLLRRAGGTVVLVGSIGGRVAMPFGGPYHATKFALEALADSWRLELRPQGVGVALIEPSTISTPIWAKAREGVEAQIAGLDAEGAELYAERLTEFAEQLGTADEKGDEVGKVAGKIAAALDGSGGRYPVGRGAGAITRLRPLVPDLVWDRVAGRFSP
jgi:NAD(P)-dependent dehydrogenase (short-subunit alcohol dehydrogenase family)